MDKKFLVIGVAAVGVYAFYKWQSDKETAFTDFIYGGSGSGSGLFGGAGSGEIYEVRPDEQDFNNIPTQEPNEAPLGFKTSIYLDNYKNYKSSGGSSKRTYVQNDDLDFTVVKDDGKTVGGYDFNTKQSITKETASNLEANKNNPIVKILRSSNNITTTKKTASREDLEKKKGGLF